MFEARAAGADLVLLIVAALEQDKLQQLHGLIHELGMTALANPPPPETNSLGSMVGAGSVRGIVTAEDAAGGDGAGAWANPSDAKNRIHRARFMETVVSCRACETKL